MDEYTGLVLEGGGMRGLFTGGVLDFFLEKGLGFPYVIGVSAGACNAASYLSKQPGRNLRINTEYLKDKRYLSLYSLLFRGSIFGMDMLFDIIPNQLDPFDYDTFAAYKGVYLVGTTDCATGEAVYYRMRDFREQGYAALQASSSLPLVAQQVRYEGRVLMDGGIADPIPVRRSERDGNTKHVVVLTQHREFVKPTSSSLKAIRRKYREYPGLCAAMERRHEVYNETRRHLFELETAGDAFVICPPEPVAISRFEKNRDKLTALYRSGYDAADAAWPRLQAFLGLEG